jgi:DNA-binding response OmpR family regulator
LEGRFPSPILIIDDDQMLTSALAALFGVRDIPYEVASDGAQALRAIARQQPGLIFLDIHMPVLDGAGVLEALRTRGLNIPIIVMSSDPDLHDFTRAWGLVSYLSKPFSIGEVLFLIESMCAA